MHSFSRRLVAGSERLCLCLVRSRRADWKTGEGRGKWVSAEWLEERRQRECCAVSGKSPGVGTDSGGTSHCKGRSLSSEWVMTGGVVVTQFRSVARVAATVYLWPVQVVNWVRQSASAVAQLLLEWQSAWSNIPKILWEADVPMRTGRVRPFTSILFLVSDRVIYRFKFGCTGQQGASALIHLKWKGDPDPQCFGKVNSIFSKCVSTGWTQC